MDAARCALRLPGVESVQLACLESRAEMPAHAWEAAEALEEGVVFHDSAGPTRIETSDGKVEGVAFHACISVFDENKRFNPKFDDSRAGRLAADTVIVTIGQGIDAAGLGVETGPGGRIVADRDTLATGIPGLFAGGDAVLDRRPWWMRWRRGTRPPRRSTRFCEAGRWRRRRPPPRPRRRATRGPTLRGRNA